MKKDDIIGGVMLLGILLMIGAFFVLAPEGKELSYGPVEIAGSTIAATALNNGQVSVTATLIRPGFVTIHTSIGGAPGPLIGTSGYLDIGTDQSITVAADTMDPESQYVALLHVDDGDEQFVITKDMPVTSGGASVRADFVAP